MGKEQTRDLRLFLNVELISSLAFGIAVFTFFAIFYDHHLLFTEQLQLFLLTDDFFLEKLKLPGGFNGYIGGFLTQFYHLPISGALIIALLLLAIRHITKCLLSRINPYNSLHPLTFLPALISGFILCSDLFPLSAITGFTGALLLGLFYTKIRNKKHRFLSGLFLIPLVYHLLGGSYISLLLIMLAFELIPSFDSEKKTAGKITVSPSSVNQINPWFLLVYFAVAAGFPLLIMQYIIFQPVKLAFMSEFYHNIPDKIPWILPVLFAIPALLMAICSLIPSEFPGRKYSLFAQITVLSLTCFYGLKVWVDFDAEEIMTYDYLVKNQKWKEVITHAEKKYPRNFLSLAMFNLSLAKTGQIGDKLFNYEQHGTEGLFLPFNKEFITPMMGNEIFYHLGLINASQQYAFESMEVMPDMEKTVRTIKRLAETNLINGHYKVSEKYLRLLEKTLFYRKWAEDTQKYLYNEKMISNHPDWGEKKKLLVREDFFFHIEDIESILHRLLRDNPNNRIAFEYLAAWYLMNRELDKFVNLLPVMKKQNYREMPVSYQEAILFYMSLTNSDPLSGSRFKISKSVMSGMDAYAKIYLNNSDARDLLHPNYSGTYWYYFHYIE
jgi:hypothetical protein